ncbi:MAG: hypothetical protein E7515_06150 [Ruminococcaceae bacterium]|nr:hypothetical protein [Oscillospiraceae bacterium]
MKPKVFIGSSVEGLEIANAIQAELEHDCEVTIWKDGIFALSEATIESLEKTTLVMDYAIFVFSPDDITKIRDSETNAIRDNVLFEFGLFMGKLGRNRVFFITPENTGNLHLPTDLLGINKGVYFERTDNNYSSAVNTFCCKIKKIILNGNNIRKEKERIERSGMFQEFGDEMDKQLSTSKTVTLYFIHSRSWRENHQNAIDEFLQRKDSENLTVYLPDFLNKLLIKSFAKNFSDGATIPSLIEDALTYFLDLKSKYSEKVEIYLYSFYPSYSFYMFDKKTIIAMYPTTDKKKNVPTFLIDNNEANDYYKFVKDDCSVLKKGSKEVSQIHIQHLKED